MKAYKKSTKTLVASIIILFCCCMNTMAQSAPALKFQTFRDKWEQTNDQKEVSFYLRFDYPVAGPQALVSNIRNWINDAIGEFCSDNGNFYYRGSMDKGADLLAYYSKEFKLHTDFSTNEIRITKFFENEYVVTILTDLLMQNADDIHSYDCATFRKSDGKRITLLDMFDFKSVNSVSQELLPKIWEYKSPNMFGGGLNGSEEPKPNDIDAEKISIAVESLDKIRFYLKENYHGDGTIGCPVSAVAEYLTPEAKKWLGKN